LASTLRNEGYATGAFSAANPYLSARFGYDHGFDVFRDFLHEELTDAAEEEIPSDPDLGWPSRLNRKLQRLRPAMGPLRPVYDEFYFRYCQRVTPVPGTLDELRRFPAADVLVSEACDWLASLGDRPFFLWLHFMDPHSPYYPKPEALALMHSEPVAPHSARYRNAYWNRSDLGPSRLTNHREEVVALYDAGIRWVDEQLARLRDNLRVSNLWENSVLAVTADHGEEFLDHGGRYHPPSHLSEELIHVPLLIRTPGSANGAVVQSPFSLLNLAPTLLDVLGMKIPREFHGRSYWRTARDGNSGDESTISESVAGCTNPFHKGNRLGSRFLSVRESRFKLTIAFDSAAEHLYDLESDPGEQAPLSPGTQVVVRKRLLEKAHRHLQESRVQRDPRLRLRACLRDLQLEWSRSFPRRPEI
jgi:arylsulfatase A-like enzyme